MVLIEFAYVSMLFATLILFIALVGILGSEYNKRKRKHGIVKLTVLVVWVIALIIIRDDLH